MTTERRNLWLSIGAVALVQAIVLGWMIWDRTRLLSSGREIVLEVIPVDPRSLFRGDYVTLGYDITRLQIPEGAKPLKRGAVVYATLQKGPGDRWQIAGWSPSPPASPAPDQVVLKGRVEYASAATASAPGHATVSYGIESFFVPEGTGAELEKLVGEKKLDALIAVGDDGTAAIKGLMVEGKRVYEEPLL